MNQTAWKRVSRLFSGRNQKFYITAELLLIPLQLLSFTGNLTKFNNIRIKVLQKYQGDDLIQLNYRMQITQEHSEYDVMINFVKLLQQTSSSLSIGYNSICNK